MLDGQFLAGLVPTPVNPAPDVAVLRHLTAIDVHSELVGRLSAALVRPQLLPWVGQEQLGQKLSQQLPLPIIVYQLNPASLG